MWLKSDKSYPVGGELSRFKNMAIRVSQVIAHTDAISSFVCVCVCVCVCVNEHVTMCICFTKGTDDPQKWSTYKIIMIQYNPHITDKHTFLFIVDVSI